MKSWAVRNTVLLVPKGDQTRHRRSLNSNAVRVLRKRAAVDAADQPRSRLQEPALPAVEGQAAGRHQRRIHRSQQREESRVKWPSLTNSC